MAMAIPDDKAFYFCNGGGYVGIRAKSMPEFVSAVKKAPANSLEFHLRGDKNDFAAWFYHVAKNKRLSKRMMDIKKKNLNGEKLRSELLKVVPKK